MTERSARKVRVGRVVGNKMEKTIVVSVETFEPHPLYGKRVKTSKRFKAHDEENKCHEGDIVKIMETRPISRDKRWRLVEVVEETKDV